MDNILPVLTPLTTCIFTYDPLGLTVQPGPSPGPGFPWHQTWNPSVALSDIRCPSLEICSNLFTLASQPVLTSGGWQVGGTHPTGMFSCIEISLNIETKWKLTGFCSCNKRCHDNKIVENKHREWLWKYNISKTPYSLVLSSEIHLTTRSANFFTMGTLPVNLLVSPY